MLARALLLAAVAFPTASAQQDPLLTQQDVAGLVDAIMVSFTPKQDANSPPLGTQVFLVDAERTARAFDSVTVARFDTIRGTGGHFIAISEKEATECAYPVAPAARRPSCGIIGGGTYLTVLGVRRGPNAGELLLSIKVVRTWTDADRTTRPLANIWDVYYARVGGAWKLVRLGSVAAQ